MTMPPWPPLRLATLLMLRSLAIAAAILVMIGLLVTFWLLPRVEQDVEARQHDMANVISRQIETYLVAPTHVLESLALAVSQRLAAEAGRAAGPGWAAPAGLEQMLDAFVAGAGPFASIYLADEDGVVRAVGLKGDRQVLREDVLGMDFVYHPLWRHAREPGRRYWSDAFLSPVNARSSVAVAVRQAGFTLIGELDLTTLSSSLQPGRHGGALTTVLLDRRGAVLLASSPDANIRHTDFSQYAALASPPQAAGRPLARFDIGGTRYLGSVLAVPELDWRVLVIVPEREAFATARMLGRILAVAIVAAVLLSVFGAALQARYLGRRFQLLQQLADDVASGEPAAQLPRSGIVEFNDLARAFEDMSKTIHNRETRLRAVMENAVDVAIQWYDRAGTVVYWNPGSERLYGYRAAYALGRNVDELFLPREGDPSFSASLAEVAQKGGSYGPERRSMRLRDGSARELLMTLFTIPGEDGQPYFVCLDLDVTEQLRMAYAREHAERTFEGLFQASPVAIAVWSERGHQLANVNAAWERLFGMSAASAIGRISDSFSMWSDEALRRDYIRRLERNEPVDGMEAWMCTASGQARLCQVSGRMVTVGHERYVMAVYMDVTAEREVTAQLRELNETLEVRVAERTAALHQANAELSEALANLRRTQEGLIRSEKMAALGALVAGVAHELSTPLGNSLIAANTVRDHARALETEMQTGLKRSSLVRFLADAQSANAIIERNLERAAELVTSFKRIAVDQSSSQRRTFVLDEVMDEILMTLRPMLKRLPYQLDVAIEAGLSLDSYPGPLGQVVTNLLNNAIVHGLDGRDHGVIGIIGRAAGDDEVWLEVHDDGCGIPLANRRRIFDPFFTTRLGQGGSGLGMHIVLNLVTNVLGGTIEVDSEVGQGTVMRVRMPRQAPRQAPGSAPAA